MTSHSKPILGEMNIDFANEIAKLESFNKHLYRPNSYLHKWWARRCGTTFRLLLKNLVTDPTQKSFYSAGGLEGKVILDPMIGGGTTLHEAIRLGANVIGYDIDPIPVLQARATLNSVKPTTLRDAFEEFLSNLGKKLQPFFVGECPHCNKDSELQFTIYGLRKSCLCRTGIFVDSYVIREENNGPSISICPHCLEISSSPDCGCEDKSHKLKAYHKRNLKCEICRTPYSVDQKTPFYARYIPLVSVGECPDHGYYYNRLSQKEQSQISAGNEIRASFKFETDLSVNGGPKSNELIRQGITSYDDLFSSRQLLYIKEATSLLANYHSIERLFLSLIVSTSLEFNSMLCGYKGASKRRAGAIRHVFAYHAYSFPHTAVENNPVFSKPASGTLRKLYKGRIERARLWAMEPRERNITGTDERFVKIVGEVDFGNEANDAEGLKAGMRNYLVKQGSATNLSLQSNSVDFIVTDPPYFDSVQYSDLAAFFRVWLRHFLSKTQSSEFVWDYGLSQSAVAKSNKGKTSANDTRHYERMLTNILLECHRVLRKETGLLIFSYHHWDYRGWASLTSGLRKANFYLIQRYIVHSENPSSVHIAKQNALSHDALMIFSPLKPTNLAGWMKPDSLETNDGKKFCKDCSTLLGWMLESEIAEDQIYPTWKNLTV